jgi:hypothetical protein
MFTKENVPMLGIMILFMEAHKCVPMVLQIGLVIWMIVNPHQVFFFNWEIMLLVGIIRNKPLLLCHQQKLNIWQLHKQQGKQYGFHHFLETSMFHK